MKLLVAASPSMSAVKPTLTVGSGAECMRVLTKAIESRAPIIKMDESNNFFNISLPPSFAFFKKAQVFYLQTVQSNP